MNATPRQTSSPPLRLARASDAPAISELMRTSVLDLFPHFYDERQTASAALHIAHIDMQLIEDGTYFVHEVDGEIVACGGWSRRSKLYTGSGSLGEDERLLDPATEPGEPLYRACGFREIEHFVVTMPDGVSVDAVAMERPIDQVPQKVRYSESKPGGAAEA